MDMEEIPVPWEELASLALRTILDYTDMQSRKTARLVCQRWNDEIESTIGLVVNIDDRRPGMADFVERTLINEATIRFLGTQDFMLDRLCRASALTFSNYVSPTIFRKFLDGRNWAHLTKLVFCGSCLISQVWTSPGPEAPAVPVTFHQLRELEVRLSAEIMHRSWNQLEQQQDRSTVPVVGHKVGTFTIAGSCSLGERARTNVKHLMQSIRSPVLTSLMTAVTSFYEADAGGPLNDFLEAHAGTLERLILSGLYTNYIPMIPPQTLDYPLRSLKSLFLTYIPKVMEENVMNDLILTQDSLESLSLVFEKLPVGLRMSQFLTNLTTLNGPTLTYLSLSGAGSRTDQVLDLGAFQACPNLKTLKLWVGFSSGRTQLKNLNQLPGSLEVLVAGSDLGTTPEFNGVRFMRDMGNLEVLTLRSVFRHGQMEVSPFLEASLRHRRLCSLELQFRSPTDVVSSFYDHAFGVLKEGRAKSLLDPLLTQVFRAENRVEFESFYAGPGHRRGGNYRHYFDLIAGNRLEWSEQVPPFNLDHGRAKSYTVAEYGERADGDRTQARRKYSLYSLTSSAERTAFELDAGLEVGPEVWLFSAFHVPEPRKARKLSQLCRRQERGRKDREVFAAHFIPIPKWKEDLGPESDSDSESEGEEAEVQNSELPAPAVDALEEQGEDSDSGEEGFEWVFQVRQNIGQPAFETTANYEVRKVKKLK